MASTPARSPAPPPGAQKPRRLRPRLHYELLVCGIAGHELLGLDAATLREQDAVFAAEGQHGWRWHRCLRCDSWIGLRATDETTREHPPEREEIEVPLRGRALRDKVVLRVIAVDRALHFVILGLVAVAILFFAARQETLRSSGYRVLADLQGGLGGSNRASGSGLLHDARRLLDVQSGTLTKIGLVVAAYAALEGAEAVGLWLQLRWAEYLTLIATAALLPVEVYELSQRLSPLKALTLLINVAVVVYLLLAKRLFGLRGGAAAEHAARERDAGWAAIERATPGSGPARDA